MDIIAVADTNVFRKSQLKRFKQRGVGIRQQIKNKCVKT